MPTVPVAKTYVNATGLSDARFQPADFGQAGEAIGRSARRLGAAIGEIAEAQALQEDRDAELGAKDADLLLSKGVREATDRLLTLQGKNAVEALPKVIEELEAARRSAGDKLRNPLAQRMFKDVAERRLEAARTTIGRYVAGERRAWENETSEAVVEGATSDAINSYLDPDIAEQHLATAVGELGKLAERSGWSAETAAKRRSEIVSGARRQIAERFIINSRLGDNGPELAESYLNKFRADLNGTDALSIESKIASRRDAYDTELRRIAAEQRRDDRDRQREARAEQRDRVAMIGEMARDTLDMIDDGFAIPVADVERIAGAAESAGKGVLAYRLRTGAAVSEFTSKASTWRPDQLQGWINSERGVVGKAPTPVQAARIEAAEKLLDRMSTGLAEDPLSFAARAGVAKVRPLDLRDPASAQARVMTALSVAEHYGRPAQFLTDEEAGQVAGAVANAGAAQKAQLAQQFATGFGRHTRQALASVAKVDPLFAHSAALATMGAVGRQTAKQIFAGQDVLTAKAVTLPSDDMLRAEAREIVGSSMPTAPQSRGAVLDAAKAIYAGEAARRGLDPAAVDSGTWRVALNKAAGASYASGQQRGGFGIYRDRSIVLPSNVAPGEFGSLMKRLTDVDLRAVGAKPMYANGKPVAAAAIRESYLIDIGPGRYVVSTNRQGTQLLRGPRGPFVLDFNALQPRLRAHGTASAKPALLDTYRTGGK